MIVTNALLLSQTAISCSSCSWSSSSCCCCSDQSMLNSTLYRALSSRCDVLPCRKRSSLDDFTTSSAHTQCKSTVGLSLFSVTDTSRSFKVKTGNSINKGVLLLLISFIFWLFYTFLQTNNIFWTSCCFRWICYFFQFGGLNFSELLKQDFSITQPVVSATEGLKL